MNKIPYKLYHVLWKDSVSVAQKWEFEGDWESDPVHIHSVGWVTKDNEDCITIMPHISECNGKELMQAAGGMTIPKCSILAKKEIDAKQLLRYIQKKKC